MITPKEFYEIKAENHAPRIQVLDDIEAIIDKAIIRAARIDYRWDEIFVTVDDFCWTKTEKELIISKFRAAGWKVSSNISSLDNSNYLVIKKKNWLGL